MVSKKTPAKKTATKPASKVKKAVKPAATQTKTAPTKPKARIKEKKPAPLPGQAITLEQVKAELEVETPIKKPVPKVAPAKKTIHRVEQSLALDPMEKLEEEVRKENTKNNDNAPIRSLFDF